MDFNLHEFTYLLNNVGYLLGKLSGGGDDESLDVGGASIDDLKGSNGEASGFASS